MKISTFKRVVKEDFSKEDQGLIEKLAYPLNLLFDAFARAMNKNISLNDNLACQLKDITITVDASGVPITKTQFKSDLKSKAIGAICIRCIDNTSAGSAPSSAPWITFTEEQGIFTINNIKGLQTGHEYQLKLVMFE